MTPTQAYLEVWRFRKDGSGKDSSRFRHGELSCDGRRAAHGPRVAHKEMKTNAVDRQLDGGGSGQRTSSSCERRLAYVRCLLIMSCFSVGHGAAALWLTSVLWLRDAPGCRHGPMSPSDAATSRRLLGQPCSCSALFKYQQDRYGF